ncbi:hypothetical protein [Chryseobacterium gossypii]|uniref:hypothetical protein n=1 Tax=Chryseobacterium gossypii TaxID=3231602 RepID=UPI003526A949
MERIHKYCLSILLVMICSNISAHIGNIAVENEDYKKLCEVYSKLLNSRNCKEKQEKQALYFTIHQKQKALALIGKIFSGKPYRNFYTGKQGLIGSVACGHDEVLKNFEKQGNECGFPEDEHFKSKVSKIRNKDYLDLMG